MYRPYGGIPFLPKSMNLGMTQPWPLHTHVLGSMHVNQGFGRFSNLVVSDTGRAKSGRYYIPSLPKSAGTQLYLPVSHTDTSHSCEAQA